MAIPLLLHKSAWRQHYIDNKEYLFTSSEIFAFMKCTFIQLRLLKFLCKYMHFPSRYRRKQKSFLMKHGVRGITLRGRTHGLSGGRKSDITGSVG